MARIRLIAPKYATVMARIRLIAPKQTGIMAQRFIVANISFTEDYEHHMPRPKKLPTNIDEQLFRQLENAPDGLRTDQLSTLIGNVISRRSLQRRLSELVDIGRLVSEGGGRSTRYRLPTRSPKATAAENYVPLSPSGANVQQLV